MERIVIRGLMTLVIALGLVGCGHHPGHQGDDHATEPAAEPAAAPSLEMTEALEAKLAAADRADGEADHVVARCGGCGLAMEGSDEHVAHAGDYSLHFCSPQCKDDFSKDLEASLLALAVPEDDPAAEQEASN